MLRESPQLSVDHTERLQDVEGQVRGPAQHEDNDDHT